MGRAGEAGGFHDAFGSAKDRRCGFLRRRLLGKVTVMDSRRSLRRSPAVGERKEQAQRLIGKAWRARREAMQSPATDEATLRAALARVEADLVRACKICEQAGARKELSIALGKLGHVALDLDDPGKARTLFEESVAAAREAGDPLRLAHAVRHLGQANHRLGRLDSAERCYEEALDLYDRAGAAHPLDHANALRPMALLKEELGDAEAARPLWNTAAKLYRSAGVEEGVRECEARLLRLSEP